MVKKLQNLERHTKYNILLTTLALSVFMAVTINAVVSMIYVSKMMQSADFEQVSFSFNRGYFAINNQVIGIPIFLNVVIIFLVWVMMINNTLKAIRKSTSFF